MDRRVKERLVGASILAFLVVLIVPELLSGPAPGAGAKLASSVSGQSRNVTIDLATRKPTSEGNSGEEPGASAVPAAAAGTEAAASPSPPHAPPSVVTMPAATPPIAPRTASHANPAPRGAVSAAPAAPLERSAPPPTSPSATKAASGHAWAVQVGVFASRANADKLVHQLKVQGFPAYVTSSGPASAPRYRVRVGPMPDRGAAAQTLSKLQSMGHSGALAGPGN